MSPAPAPLSPRRPGSSELEESLRALDPARTDPDLDVARDPVAGAVLRGVLAAPVDASATGVARVSVPARPARRRAIAVAGMTAAIAVGSVAAPRLLGGGEALAWSATPHALSPAMAAEAEAACDERIKGNTRRPPGTDVSGLRAVVTEARGSLVLVYETDSRPSPTEIVCYVQDGRVVASGGGYATAESPPLPAIPSDSIQGNLGAVYSTRSERIRGVTGRVGADVVGVVLDSVARGPVTATVRHGHFGAWWPDTPESEAQENPGNAPEVTGATLTLRDGSTRRITVDELIGSATE